ncbi:MAG: TonB-linked outer membrane protein, SusC/RagA family [Bacteroidetes bacterium]|nr:TonB-linked outer membrane protein, SusC/RagA family [Bacteroidota bacterium]
MQTNKRRKITHYLCMCGMFMITVLAWGQTKSVSGVVKDAKGEAIIGASVVAKGSTTGTITDVNGNFTLSVPPATKALIVSFIGMDQQEVALTGKQLAITLTESSVALNEVVAIGYGTMKKSDLTGAISSVNSGKITEAGRNSVLSTLQGSVPGVQIQQTSSRAGSDFSIIVRGQNSISGNTTPLYVVDGIVTGSIEFLNPQDIEKVDVLKDASSSAIYGSRGANGVVIIQTKGAQNAKSSKTTISYDGYYGSTQKTRMPDFMNTQEWMQYRTMCYQTATPSTITGDLAFTKTNLKTVWCGNNTLNAAGQPLYSNGTFSGSQFMLNRYINNQSTDWTNLVTQTGHQQNHYIGISGSTKDISYVIGAGFQNEQDIFVNTDYSRYNLKGSLSATLNKNWSAGLNINMAYSKQQYGSNRAILNAFAMSPIFVPYANGNLDATLNTLVGNLILYPGKTTESVKDAAGNAIYANSIGQSGPTSTINPLVDVNNTSNEAKKYVVLGTAYLQYSPIKNFQLKSSFSPNLTTYRSGFYMSSLAQENLGKDPVANVTNNTDLTYTWDNQANYKFTINKDHNFDIMGLYSITKENDENYYMYTAGYNWDFDWYNTGAATTTTSTQVSSYYSEYALMSYALRANYTYKGKYLATASMRYDGSSRLAEGHKWASFPSVALGWRVTEEKFMDSSKKWLSNLKLRLSLGYTGSTNISPFQTQTLASTKTYYNFGSTVANGTAIGSPASTELTWEKTREFDFGFDFGFLDNRINGSVDVYDRLSSGLLQNITLPLESGAGSMAKNLGKVNNRGIEIALNGVIIQSKDFTWSANASFASNKNKIVDLFGITTNGYTYINSSSQKWIVGQNINSIYGYVYDGVWTAADLKAAIAAKDPRAVTSSGKVIAGEGQAKVKDFDGNGIDTNDRRVQGHSDPTWTGGIGTTLTYKGFDFNMNIYTAQGMTQFSPFMETFTNFNDRGTNKLNIDYYIPAGMSVLGNDGLFTTLATSHNSQSYPTPYNYGTYWHTSSESARDMPGAWVDASYVKVRNIALGYTLPKSVLKLLGVQQFRVYCNVLNPFVFTKYKGFDPEWASASMGKDNGPSTITYQVGVNLKF